MPISSEKIVESALTGLSVAQLKTVFNDPSFKKAWGELTKDAQKRVIVNAKVTGVKDVDDLVDAMNAAVAASEEYFEGLKKYRSTVTSMNLAWKEGSAHMKEYLEQAKRSGGQTAVLAAVATYLTNSLKESMDKIDDSVTSLHRYGVEEETFARTTRYSVENIKDMRDELNLTKDDMREFFSILKEGNALGLDTEKIKKVYSQLKAVYGKDAMGKMQDFTEILPLAPEIRVKFMTDPSGELDSETIQRIVGSGKISKLIELRAAGLFGGKAEASSNASFENAAQQVKALGEKVKDELLKHLPHQAIILSGMSGLLGAAVFNLIKLSATAGAIRQILFSTLPRQGAFSGIPSGRMGTGWRTAGRVAGTAAGLYGGYQIASSLTGALKGPGESEGAGGGIGNYAETGLNALIALSLAKNLLPKNLTSGLLGKGIFSTVLKAGKAFAQRYGAKTLLGGGILGLGLDSMYTVNKFQANTKGVEDLGYAPGFMEQLKAVGTYGLDSRIKKPTEEKMPTIDLKDIKQIEDAVAKHKEVLDSLGGDLQEEIRNFALTAKGISGAAGDGKGYVNAMGTARDAIEKRAKGESKFYSQQIAIIKNEMGFIQKSNKNFKTDTIYISLQKKLEVLENERNLAKAKSIQDFSDLIESITDLSQWGATGKRGMETLSRGVTRAQMAIEKSKMAGGEFEATLGAKEPEIARIKGQMENIDLGLKKNAELKEDAEKTKDTSQLIILDKQENDLLRQKADLQKNLNDVFMDTSAYDILHDRLKMVNDTLLSTSALVQELDGSYTSMAPLWREEIENKKLDLAATNAAFEEEKRRGSKPGSKAYQARTQEIMQKEIDISRSTFEYAKKTRDAKMEEANLSRDWLNDQADFMDEMGGYFGDVLAKRSQAVQKERENISVLEDYLKNANLSGFERQKAEIDLEKEKMKVVKDTVGIQKSSYEKFVGMAFGALGDVGFKKGRMESVLTMGRKATETQNRAGLFVGASAGLTRNQISALNATGFDSKGNPVQNVSSPLIQGEGRARMAIGGAASRPEMKLGGQIEVSLSEDLTAKVKGLMMELSNNADFGNAMIRANGLVTINNRASTSAN